MTDRRDATSGRPAQAASTTEDALERAHRRRLRERVFGDVLPETTGDDRAADRGDERGNDDWLRSNVPPHHG